MPDRQPFLKLLGPPLRKAILRHYTPNSCVASSAIGKLVLNHLGFEVRPISLRAMLTNQPWLERATREGHVPRSVAERERWFIESGAHGIGLGVVDPNDHETPAAVNGLHLGLLVDNTWLWDLSIDQASRPMYGIVIKEPFLGNVAHSPQHKAWLKGRVPITWSAPGQGLVVYSVKPNDRRYLEHPNWRADGRDAETRKAIATEALLALRGIYTVE
jgi:hypothetical protein